MSKKMSFLVATIFSLIAITAKAQYPKIPADVQKASNEMMEHARQQSDIAWGKALPDNRSLLSRANPIFLGHPAQPICHRQKYRHFQELRAVVNIRMVVVAVRYTSLPA